MLKYFGFNNFADFFVALAKPKILLQAVKISAFFSTFAVIIEHYFGVPAAIMASFILLNVLEWLTGVWAAIHRGGQFESKKAGRAVLKIFTYLVIIFILNQFKNFAGEGSIWYLYSWSYWTIFNAISLVLLRSIFENLHIMEVKEAMVVYRILDTKYFRVFSILFSPPSEEKQQR